MSFVKEMILTGDQIVVKTDIYILVHVLINTVSIKFFIYYTVLFYVYHYYTAVLRGIIYMVLLTFQIILIFFFSSTTQFKKLTFFIQLSNFNFT